MQDLFSIQAKINGTYELVLVHTSEPAFDRKSNLLPKFIARLSYLLHHCDWEVSMHFERKDRPIMKKSQLYKYHLHI